MENSEKSEMKRIQRICGSFTLVAGGLGIIVALTQIPGHPVATILSGLIGVIGLVLAIVA